MFDLLEINKDFVVVNKWPGISLQREDEQPGLLALVAESLGIDHLRPVHRLDKMTSGAVVMARTLDCNRELARQFAAREVSKFYIALSDHKPKKKQGTVQGGMIKARRSAWKLTPDKANYATTQFFCSSVTPGLRLFLLRPLTGKTHQIRVALKSLGAPILGDELYGGTVSDRGYLHALSLGFRWNGQDVRFCALPGQGEQFQTDVFRQALAELGDPAALGASKPWPQVRLPPVMAGSEDQVDDSC